jgi:hypothetical protein
MDDPVDPNVYSHMAYCSARMAQRTDGELSEFYLQQRDYYRALDAAVTDDARDDPFVMSELEKTVRDE